MNPNKMNLTDFGGMIPSHHTDSLPQPLDGVLVVDKPEGMTSFAVVNTVKRWFRFKKLGHCGTLDPFATGVLVLCVNQATRIADELSGQDKVYEFTLRMGVETDTLDRTGTVVHTYSGPPRGKGEFQEALDRFRGSYLQQVPRYAAVKVQGRPLYDWTRRGIEVERPQREVHIHRLELLDYRWPEARLEVHCSKGTYIRQLSSDLGRVIECGAHVSELRRMASGLFSLRQAVSLGELKQLCTGDRASEKGYRSLPPMISLNDALSHLPAVLITEKEVIQRLEHGHLDSEWEKKYRTDLPGHVNPIRLVTNGKRLLALWWRESNFQPRDNSNVGARRNRLRVFR